ncbi:DNA-binding protein [Thermoactinospora rubra]|uniref:DNA-binding protein n=1 Tax=Thermoactinospora rubra TaxID=1088767 RepID=UPI000A0F72E0|nr:DNA-binding protein [Thermoactinospora rubra]
MKPQVATLVLDCEGLSAWMVEGKKAYTFIKAFQRTGCEFVVSANTIVEASHERVSMPRMRWVLSQVRVEPVTEASAKAAAKLLKDAGLHGHKHALDATVAELALRQPGPVAMLTSDVDDMAKLCGNRIALIPC